MSDYRNSRFVALMAAFWLFLIVSGGAWGQDSAKPEAKADKQKALLTERLAILRDLVRLSTAAYKTAGGSYEEVSEATRRMLQAELELCASDKERIAVLEKLVAEAKTVEDIT